MVPWRTCEAAKLVNRAGGGARFVAAASLALLLGCGAKSIEETGRSSEDAPPDATDAGADAEPPTRMREDPPDDPPPPPTEDPLDLPQSMFEEPGCPEPAERRQRISCEPGVEDTCPNGQGCFPFVNYPANPCDPETFGTRCEPVGEAVQGESCIELSCAEGFLCVATGVGTQCAQICILPGGGTCPPGLVCGSVDIEGFGVCF